MIFINQQTDIKSKIDIFVIQTDTLMYLQTNIVYVSMCLRTDIVLCFDFKKMSFMSYNQEKYLARMINIYQGRQISYLFVYLQFKDLNGQNSWSYSIT